MSGTIAGSHGLYAARQAQARRRANASATGDNWSDNYGEGDQGPSLMGKFLENMQGTFEALANAQSQLAKAQADAKKAQADQVKKEKQAQKDAEAALKSRGKRLRASIFTSEEGVLGPPTAARSKVFAT